MADHILIVEDDASLSEWLADFIGGQGFEVSVANRGDVAVELIKADNPDLVVLDIMLPGLDGLQVCKTVREFYTNPILMLTAFDEEADEVLGLEMGADDYLGKPVRARALLARIRALLRRGTEAAAQKADEITVGNLCIDAVNRWAKVDQQDIGVNTNEFEVLWMLAKHAGDIVSRDELLSNARGIEYDGFDRSIDIRVSRLRKRLNEAEGCKCSIKTVRGRGYVLVVDN